MPIYEYLCAGCSGTFEELVRGEQDAVSCPDCGGSTVTKLLSSFATRKPVMAAAAVAAAAAAAAATSRPA
jgi:putative FmdB family regulatory protein